MRRWAFSPDLLGAYYLVARLSQSLGLLAPATDHVYPMPLRWDQMARRREL